MPTVSKERRGLSPAIVLFVCLFAVQASILVLSPILPRVADEFGVSTAAAAQLRSISGFTAGVFALVLAARGDRYRLTSLLHAGLLLLAVGAVGSAASPGFAFVAGAQIVVGIGLAMVLSGGVAASEAWAESGGGSRVLSWALIGQPVAWIVGQPVVGAIAGINWRWAFVAVPAFSALMAAAVVARRDRTASDSGVGCDPAGLWRIRGIKPWALGELLAFSAWGGALVYSGAYFVEARGAGIGLTGVVLGLGAAMYLPGNFLGRRFLRSGAMRPLVGFAAAAAVAVALMMVVDGGLVAGATSFAVLAFLAGGRTISGAALGLRLSGGRHLAAMSLRTSMLQFGYLIGAGVGGWALAGWGFTGLGWVLAALFLGAALVDLRPRRLDPAMVQTAGPGSLRRDGA